MAMLDIQYGRYKHAKQNTGNFWTTHLVTVTIGSEVGILFSGMVLDFFHDMHGNIQERASWKDQ